MTKRQKRDEWSVDGDNYHLTQAENRALDFILPLSFEYPAIESWFFDRVVPGLRNGSRKMIEIERHGRLVALGIGKMDTRESKICTVRVAPEYHGRGMGVRVFDGLMSWMGDGRPHATVSEEKLPNFERLFDHYGYVLTSTHSGRYRLGKVEYLFNERSRFNDC